MEQPLGERGGGEVEEGTHAQRHMASGRVDEMHRHGRRAERIQDGNESPGSDPWGGLVNLYAAETCAGRCPMRWKRLVRREASSVFQWPRLSKKLRMALRKSAKLG